MSRIVEGRIARVRHGRYRCPSMKNGRVEDAGHERANPPDLRPVEGTEADEDLALLAKALGHPTRVAIVRFLRQGEGASCGELVRALGLAQSTVSEHLRILREAGIARAPEDSPRGPYRVDVHRLRRLKALTGSL